MKINENRRTCMKTHENRQNPCTFMGYICFEKKKMGYMLYAKKINARPIYPLKKNKFCKQGT